MFLTLEEYDNTADELNQCDELILLFEIAGDHQIWSEKSYLHIIRLDINVFYAFYSTYSDSSKEYELDFDFYLFYNNTSFEQVYSEQGSSLPKWATMM